MAETHVESKQIRELGHHVLTLTLGRVNLSDQVLWARKEAVRAYRRML